MGNAVELSIFSSRLAAVCDEAGALLQRAAFSPNIKDRLDFSCAIFDRQGELCAQAAHIPVHLGSMAFAMREIVQNIDWQDGDAYVLNDPYLGGTHLPDVTVIEPVFIDSQLVAFVANRAHHANIGATQPGSMPIASSLEEEGVVIAPQKIVESGQLIEQALDLLADGKDDIRLRGDFLAQVSACSIAAKRLVELIQRNGVDNFEAQLTALNRYGETLAGEAFSAIPNGVYCFEDFMDDDGQGNKHISISLELTIQGSQVCADFKGTSPQVAGNINCPLSVTAAAVYYVFRCLLPGYAPACAGTFNNIRIKAREGCLLNAKRPAAVAAGNVETSSRVVDVVLGALAKALPQKVPAASQGTMNNVAMGSSGPIAWDYYETLGGGSGAGASGHGLSGRQTHMTNTLNTPVESIEAHYPIRMQAYSLRKGSGGKGQYNGGEGIVRAYEFLSEAQATLLTERRLHSAWALGGAEAGRPGENLLNGTELPPKCELKLSCGDVLELRTPGGGGWNPESH